MSHYRYFKFPYASYMDVSLMRESRTKKELVAEYKKLRTEANRRLDRLAKYDWMKESNAYQYNKDRFRGGISRMTKAELAKQLRDAAIFLGSSSSTITGQKRRRERLRKTFKREWGLDFLKRNDVVSFARYLGAARAFYGSGAYTMTDIEAKFRAALEDDQLDMEMIKSDFEEFEKKAEESPYYSMYKDEADKRSSSKDYDRYKIR